MTILTVIMEDDRVQANPELFTHSQVWEVMRKNCGEKVEKVKNLGCNW